MIKQEEYNKAIKLRTEGKSLGEISNFLKISKSTASRWCKNIIISEKIKSNLEEKRKEQSKKALMIINKKRANKTKKELVYYYAKGKEDIKNINKRDLLIAGISLYWGEGYKKGNNEFGITNSDPKIICLIMKWLKDIYLIKKEDLILRVSINKIHKHRLEDILDYWSDTTKIPKTQFTKTSFIKSKTKKEFADPNNYFGTLRIKVRKGRMLRERILGSISQLADTASL